MEPLCVASQVVHEAQPTTPVATKEHAEPIPRGNTVVEVPVRTFLISAVSFSESAQKGIIPFEETSITPLRILKRAKNKEIGSNILPNRQSGVDMQQTPMVLRDSTRQKRKMRDEAQKKVKQAEKSKKQPSNKNKAQMVKENGLVQVKVAFPHCSQIAKVTGFQTSQVMHALQEDNLQRPTLQPEENEEIEIEFEPTECTVGFEPDHEVELDSDLD